MTTAVIESETTWANDAHSRSVSSPRPGAKGVGRPTKLTPQLAHKVYEYLKSGASFTATCRAVGISKEVFRRWRLPCADVAPDHEHGPACLHVIERMERRDGELVGTGEFVAFVALVERALGEHEARLAFVITRAAEKNWRAALEILQRRYPENWKIPVKQELTGRSNESIQIDDARERLMEKVRQARSRMAVAVATPADASPGSPCEITTTAC